MKANIHDESSKQLLNKRGKQLIYVKNLFRELSMNNVSGYSELNDKEKDLFDVTYKKHLASLDEEERISYLENNLDKVDNKVNVVKVHFKNGERYIYLDGYQWFKLS